jgi:hypothetical protein
MVAHVESLDEVSLSKVPLAVRILNVSMADDVKVNAFNSALSIQWREAHS